MPMSKSNEIFSEITDERNKQRGLGYTAEHDDRHHTWHWIRFIIHQLDIGELVNVRERFIKIAALCVAAIESMDRRK
jgi:hypothetical protein